MQVHGAISSFCVFFEFFSWILSPRTSYFQAHTLQKQVIVLAFVAMAGVRKCMHLLGHLFKGYFTARAIKTQECLFFKLQASDDWKF